MFWKCYINKYNLQQQWHFCVILSHYTILFIWTNISVFRLMYISTFDLYFHHKLGLKFYLNVVLKSLKFHLFIPVDTLKKSSGENRPIPISTLTDLESKSTITNRGSQNLWNPADRKINCLLVVCVDGNVRGDDSSLYLANQVLRLQIT